MSIPHAAFSRLHPTRTPIPGRAALRERYNHMAGLTAERVKQFFDDYRAGNYADIMIAFDELEDYDDILSACADKREAALGEAEWSIRPISGAIGKHRELQELADRQQAYLAGVFTRVTNLTEAVQWLGSASFRGYAHLHISRRHGNITFEPVPQWYWADPAGEGIYYYNETAARSSGGLKQVDPAEFIIRVCRRPIDITAIFACLIKYNGEQGWQSFLDVFGNPAIFFEYPKGTSDQKAKEYDAIVREIIADGRGGYPAGGKITTVETQAKGGESFQSIAEWCNKKIVRKALAGELTLLTESGSGTLAGNAHMEGFKALAVSDCRSISSCVQRQFVDAELDRAFPNKPHLVEFVLDYPERKDLAVETAAIAQLVQSGFIPSEEQVAERTGYNCKYERPSLDSSAIYAGKAAGYVPTQPAMEDAMGMPMIPDPHADPASVKNRVPAPTTEPPLTEAELEAFRALGHPNPDRMMQRGRAVYTRLLGAADIPAKP